MAAVNASRIANKQKRQQQHLKAKKARESAKRDERLRRRRLEDKNPHLRAQRQAANVPQTIDSKRTWDAADSGDEDDVGLGRSIDVLHPQRSPRDRSVGAGADEDHAGEADGDSDSAADEAMEEPDAAADADADHDRDADHDHDSMLDSESDRGDEGGDGDGGGGRHRRHHPHGLARFPPHRASSEAPSAAPSTATDMTVRPDALKARFPRLFDPDQRDPKVLVTTSINSTLHHEAQLLATLFPNSKYVRRTAHAHAYKYSIREICRYASDFDRGYTHVVVLNEDLKRPAGIDVVHLPTGPMFHFSISNWVPGSRLPGHGNPTNHYPELILNGFRTPLGLLAAHLFKSLFPPRPEVHGRQVVTLHNQRDYIFLRRHRYVFRHRKTTEKSIQGADGKKVDGAEDIRVGLQELGPRFTMKLRRVDKGIQHASGQEWRWKAGDEKVRTRFSL